jgi:hypothetical protein
LKKKVAIINIQRENKRHLSLKQSHLINMEMTK